MSLEASKEQISVAIPLINEWFQAQRPELTKYLPRAITDVRKKGNCVFANVLIQVENVTHFYRVDLDLKKLEVSNVEQRLPREGG